MADWYYEKDGSQQGPVSADQVERLLEGHVITGKSLLWRSGFQDWQPLNEVPQFSNIPESAAASGGLKLRAPSVKSNPKFVRTSEANAVNFPSREAENTLSASDHALDDYDSFWGSFEFRFFCWSLLIAATVTTSLYLLKYEAFTLPLMIQGLLCMLVGGIIFRIRTFQEGMGWGLGGLLIGITDLFFIFMFWDRICRPFALLVGGILSLVGFVVLAGVVPQ